MELNPDGLISAARNMNDTASQLGERAFKLLVPKPVRKRIDEARKVGQEFFGVYTSPAMAAQRVGEYRQEDRQLEDDTVQRLTGLNEHEHRSTALRRIYNSAQMIHCVPSEERSESDHLKLKKIVAALAEMPVHAHPIYRLPDEQVQFFDGLISEYIGELTEETDDLLEAPTGIEPV